jgi:RNA polymerase sigma-70 factor (ECF subfamily)
METMDAQPTLRDLAAFARRDGGDAAEVLLGRVRQLALRYARARLGRFGAEDVAQDVAQEVCMAVHTGLRTFDDRGLPFEAFVYAIAARKVADAQRQLIRGPESVAEVPDSSDLAAGPEHVAMVRDEAGRAMALIRTLPTQQQEILTLRVAVGMSTDETAAALGMTPGAIRVAQHRALAKLRELLAAQEGVAS